MTWRYRNQWRQENDLSKVKAGHQNRTGVTVEERRLDWLRHVRGKLHDAIGINEPECSATEVCDKEAGTRAVPVSGRMPKGKYSCAEVAATPTARVVADDPTTPATVVAALPDETYATVCT